MYIWLHSHNFICIIKFYPSSCACTHIHVPCTTNSCTHTFTHYQTHTHTHTHTHTSHSLYTTVQTSPSSSTHTGASRRQWGCTHLYSRYSGILVKIWCFKDTWYQKVNDYFLSYHPHVTPRDHFISCDHLISMWAPYLIWQPPVMWPPHLMTIILSLSLITPNVRYMLEYAKKMIQILG